MRHCDTYMLQSGQSGGTRTHIHILKVCALNAHAQLRTTDTKSAGPVVTEAPTLERPSYMQPSRRIRRQLSYRLILVVLAGFEPTTITFRACRASVAPLVNTSLEDFLQAKFSFIVPEIIVIKTNFSRGILPGRPEACYCHIYCFT